MGDQYFKSYDSIEVHQLMLKDKARLGAYESAIFQNAKFFTGKVVMDVGCGTGILSLFAAKAGAKKVYAIEASSISHIAQEIVQCNGFGEIIQVIPESVENTCIPEKVDIIISEWMGFYLLHESMIASVLYARDKFLKSDGALFPSQCKLWGALCNLKNYFANQINCWNDVCGFDMQPIREAVLKQVLSKPLIITIEQTDLLSVPICMKTIDLKSISMSEIKHFKCTGLSTVLQDCCLHGLCIWFDCDFPNCMEDCKPIVLSTSPAASETHWKQTIILLPEDSFLELATNDCFRWTIELEQDAQNFRQYNITCELFPDNSEHPIPCQCGSTRCLIINQLYSKNSDENSV